MRNCYIILLQFEFKIPILFIFVNAFYKTIIIVIICPQKQDCGKKVLHWLHLSVRKVSSNIISSENVIESNLEFCQPVHVNMMYIIINTMHVGSKLHISNK